ncbi:tellurite resistance TerB family protein [Aureimonas frigidaquae]|uniref:tellurite resistance TerB family protein n=1 Tax=Aureimonas frigidaquae TaxID=424757 RepID=UPI000780B58F|nr:tellurite resistance TerB family protein [Aureimonas frigidaquae]
MIDARKLLDQFLGTQGQSGRGQGGFGQSGRGQGAPLGDGRSSGGGLEGQLGDLVGGLLGNGRGGSRGGSSGGFGGGLGSVLGGGSGGGLGGALGPMVAGGLASYLLRGKGAKKLGGSALKLGGLALVAGLGYKAWQNYQAQQQGAGAAQRIAPQEIPDASDTAFAPPPGEEQEHARLLLSAMIAAAKADGSIDAAEEDAIFGKMDSLDLDAEEKALVMDELRRPMPIADLAAMSRTPEMAVEVYVASVMVIDADNDAERRYLDALAQGLQLPPALVTEIHTAHRQAVTAA